MYINFSLLNSRQLTPNEFMFLLAVKTNKTEDNSAVIEYHFKEVLEKFKDTNLITFTKPKNKSENDYNTVRLSSVGLEWVDDITTPEVSEGDLKMRDYLCDIYLYDTNTQTGEKILKDKDRTIGNKKSVGLYISILRQHLGLTLYEFYYFCDYFLSIYIYTKRLEYIFFNKKENQYGKFKNCIEDSPLYQFWEQNEQEVRQYFKQKIKE